MKGGPARTFFFSRRRPVGPARVLQSGAGAGASYVDPLYFFAAAAAYFVFVDPSGIEPGRGV